MALKHDRDLKLRSFSEKHNLGVLPSSPFTDEIALNLTNRIWSRLKDLDKDLDDKKVTFISSFSSVMLIFLYLILLLQFYIN